jgi:hypothetical protein
MPKIEPKSMPNNYRVTPSTPLVTGLGRALAPLGDRYEARSGYDHPISRQIGKGQ